jgi:hypothetical protein
MDALGDEIEDVVFEAKLRVRRPGNAPVDHEDVEALLEKVLDEALAWREVEDVGLADERHHEEDGHAVDLVRLRPIVIELERAAGVNDVLRRKADGRVASRDVLEALHGTSDGAFDLDADGFGEIAVGVGHRLRDRRGHGGGARRECDARWTLRTGDFGWPGQCGGYHGWALLPQAGRHALGRIHSERGPARVSGVRCI